ALFEITCLRIEPGGEITDGQSADFDERFAADADGPRLSVEALSLASRTADDAHVLFQLQAARPGGRLFEAAEQLRNDALPFAGVLPRTAAALFPLIGDVSVAAAVQQCFLLFARQALPRCFEVDAERLSDAFVDVPPPAAHTAQLADERDRSLEETQ